MSYLDRFKHSPKKSDASDWNGPQGSDSMDKDKLNRQPDKGYVKPVSILGKVERNAAQDEGFSGKLTSDE
jgi:hypothetical protein